MPIYRLFGTSIDPLKPSSFTKLRVREHVDILQLLRDHIEIVAQDLMVIAENFCSWDTGLLCIDKEANLVVVDVIRTEDGNQTVLRAIPHSAMISALTFEQVVQAHREFLRNLGVTLNAKQRIFNFLDWKRSKEEAFGADVKIIVVAESFSKKLTDSVRWLNNKDVDIRCVMIKPYRYDDSMFLEAQQIIPLPDAEDIQEYVQDHNHSDNKLLVPSKPERSKFTLSVDGKNRHGLNKRYLMYYLTKAIIRKGGSPEKLAQIADSMGNRLFFDVEGVVNEKEFFERLTENDSPGKRSKSIRYFCKQDELFYVNGRTYALSNQWGPWTEQAARKICNYFDHFGVDFEKENAQN